MNTLVESAVEIWVGAACNLASLTYPIHFAKVLSAEIGV